MSRIAGLGRVMTAALVALIIILIVGVVLLGSSVRLVQQYERGVVLRFGRPSARCIREPGLRLIIPVVDRMRKVTMQTVVMGVPAQEAITRDNVTRHGRRGRVLPGGRPGQGDRQRAELPVRGLPGGPDLVALGDRQGRPGHLLSDRDKLNAELKEVIDAPTEEPWGLQVERVEVKDVTLPESMKRSMSRQAEAERERRARVIAADGEFQASKKLAQAARHGRRPRRPCSCGCCRPWSRSPPRRTAPW